MTASPAFELKLFDPGDEGASFRLRNADGQLQREHILDRGSDLMVQGELAHVVHGTFTPGGPPASLIISEFRFLSADNSKHFRNAIINFQFSHPKSKNAKCPQVVAIAPFDHFSMNQTVFTEEVTRNANISAEASAPVGVGASAGVGWELSRSVEKKDRGTLVGVIRVEGKFVGPSVKNTARWALTENESQGDGLPSYLRTAILIKRKDDGQFNGQVNVKADVNNLRDRLRGMFGEVVDPIIFDPSLPPLGDVPDGVDVNNLSAVKLEKYGNVRATTVITTTTTVDSTELTAD